MSDFLFQFSNENHVVQRDAFDDDAYLQAAEAIPELAELEDAFAAKTKHGRELLEDLHSSLYKDDPVLLEEGELTPLLKQHKDLLDTLYQTTEYRSWHAQTRFDQVRSALGTVELAKAIQEKLPANPDERRRVLRQRIRQAEENVEGQIEAASVFGAFGGPGGDGYSMDGAGDPGLSDLQDVVKAGAALERSAYLRKLMEKAGRDVTIAQTKHRARVRHGPDEIVDVELGNDLARVLPSELIGLVEPALKLDFLKRFTQGQLLQYRIEGAEPLGRGPVVVCLDTSGSMKEWGKEFWAKGLALGLMSIALTENRKFCLIEFSGEDQIRKFEAGSDGQGGKPTMDMLIKALEHSFYGGTHFQAPLEAALKELESSKFKNADVIMLTDGDGYMDEEWAASFKRRKEAKAARLLSVLIGFNSRTLGPISDGIERIDDLEQDEAVTDLVFGGI